MTDVILNTGDVVPEFDPAADPEGQSSVFGAGPQWDDGLDSTWAVLRAYSTGVVSYFGNAYAPLIGNADGKGFLSFRVRWLPDNARLLAVTVGLRVDGVEALAAELPPVPGGIRNSTRAFGPADASGGYTWADITTAIGEDRVTVFTSLFDPLPAHADYLGTIYGLVVTALDPAVVSRRIPARRLWPRDDDLGIGNGRIYPPPNTQQSGARFGSGAPL